MLFLVMFLPHMINTFICPVMDLLDNGDDEEEQKQERLLMLKKPRKLQMPSLTLRKCLKLLMLKQRILISSRETLKDEFKHH